MLGQGQQKTGRKNCVKTDCLQIIALGINLHFTRLFGLRVVDYITCVL